jgi:hypothetical protein
MQLIRSLGRADNLKLANGNVNRGDRTEGGRDIPVHPAPGGPRNMMWRWTMEDFDYGDGRGLNRTNAAYRIGDHRDRLDEMMTVALYPDGDGADDEVLLRYATDAAKGNPEDIGGIRAKGLEYDIAVGMASNHAVSLLVAEVDAIGDVTDARLPAVARVVMGAAVSMNRSDSTEAPPEWLLSLLDRLAEAIDPEGGRCAECGRNLAPTFVGDSNPDGWYCPRCCDPRILRDVGDGVKVECPGCAVHLRCEVCGFGHPQVCAECGRNLEKMASGCLAIFCATCQADHDNDDEELSDLPGDRNSASEECRG